MTPKADKDEVRQFLRETHFLSTASLREDVRAVLRASASANRSLYDEIRREPSMKNFWDELTDEARA
ncbi:MAG: hypothetical protein IJ679_00295, partial [Lachnospiraceae bacterium]|nr:hypothetical protein [Lachnospiraceae bacterium]